MSAEDAALIRRIKAKAQEARRMGLHHLEIPWNLTLQRQNDSQHSDAK